MKAELIRREHGYILYDADFVENPELLAFTASDWAERSAIVGFAEGRGTTFFIQHDGKDYVLRHYRRGGLIARCSEDRYVWTGLARTRAWREWHLLARLRDMALPVPRPVAARVIRHGLTYTADIMTRRIANATTLADELGRHALPEGRWQVLGALLRRFHQQGVWHADLNANNILLDEAGDFYLIDFDRGRLRRPRRRWQVENLARLRRSLDKFRANQDVFHFAEQDWQALQEGYARTACG